MKSILAVLMAFSLIMCSGSHDDKRTEVSESWLKKEILRFVRDECESESYVHVFIRVLESRQILKQIAGLINGPMANKEIIKISVYASIFNLGNVRVLIVDEDMNGYGFISRDSMCNKLYYTNRIDIDPDFKERSGCEIEKVCQGVIVRFKRNSKGKFEVVQIKFYEPIGQ